MLLFKTMVKGPNFKDIIPIVDKTTFKTYLAVAHL